MQTIRDLRNQSEGTVVPTGYTVNGWSSVLPHEMNILFQAVCYAVNRFDTKAEVLQSLEETKAVEGTFADLDKNQFKSEEEYNSYINLLEKFKKFVERSGYTYPANRAEALDMLIKWGLILDQGDHYDVAIDPFPDVRDIFKLQENERLALDHIKLETLVHPMFSKLVLMLHQKDETIFSFSKAELREMLDTNDAMLTEVLIKLTPYLEEPIENFQQLPDTEKMRFTIIWERIYEDFLGNKDPQTAQ